MKNRRPLNDSIHALLNSIIKSSGGSVERPQLPVPSSNHLLYAPSPNSNHLLDSPEPQPSCISNCNVDMDISLDFLIK